MTIKTLRASASIAAFKNAIRAKSISAPLTVAATPLSTPGALSSIDVTALATLLMMEAAQDAQNDLRSLVGQVEQAQVNASDERQILKIIADVTQSIRNSRWRPHRP